MIDRIPTATAPDERIVITRIFDAPRERVFAAWTTAEHWARWFGPDGCTIPTCTLDARPGGRLHFHILHDGNELWVGGTFREVVAPERIVLTLGFQDEAGNPVPGTTYGHPHIEGHPLDSIVTVTFADRGDKTEMTMERTVPLDDPSRADMIVGWNMGFNHLDALLAAR